MLFSGTKIYINHKKQKLKSIEGRYNLKNLSQKRF